MSQHCRANPCCGDRPCSGTPLPQHTSGLTHHNKKPEATEGGDMVPRSELERLESIHRTEIAEMALRFREVNVERVAEQLARIMPSHEATEGGAHEKEDILDLYRMAAHVDVTMEGVHFLGVNRSAFKRAWEADRAALKAEGENR